MKKISFKSETLSRIVGHSWLDLKVGSEANDKHNLMVLMAVKLTQSTSYSTFLILINSRVLLLLFLLFSIQKFSRFFFVFVFLFFVAKFTFDIRVYIIFYNPKLL